MLAGRYALGAGNEQLRRKFQFETVAGKANLFSCVIESKLAVWVGAGDNPEIEQLVTPQVEELSQGAGFFVTPIEIRGKVIGVFYADRQPSGRPLDDGSFTSFKHFAQQGNLALAYLSGG